MFSQFVTIRELRCNCTAARKSDLIKIAGLIKVHFMQRINQLIESYDAHSFEYFQFFTFWFSMYLQNAVAMLEKNCIYALEIHSNQIRIGLKIYATTLGQVE